MKSSTEKSQVFLSLSIYFESSKPQRERKKIKNFLEISSDKIRHSEVCGSLHCLLGFLKCMNNVLSFCYSNVTCVHSLQGSLMGYEQSTWFVP